MTYLNRQTQDQQILKETWIGWRSGRTKPRLGGVRVISDENKSRKVGIETPTQFSLARKHEAFLGSETLFLADH